MATLGWLKIGITTDTSMFAKGLKSASKELDGWKSTVMGIAGAVGVAFGVKDVVGFVKASMNASDATHDMAERLGVSAEALGKMQHVAQIAGIDNETLAASWEKMNEKLGDVARTGEGPAAEALRRVGLSARSLAMESPVDSFKTLIGVLGSIQNPAERASVAVDLFGKSGQKMIQLAAQGKDGIAALEEEYVKLGGSISNVNAEKIGEANDAIDRMGLVVQGVGNSLAVELAPYITYVADLMVDWATSGGGAAKIVSTGVGWVTDGIGYAADAVQFLQTAFYGAQSVILQALSKVSEGIAAVMQDLQSIMDNQWVKAASGGVGIIWDLMGKDQKKALTDSSSFFAEWAKDLDKQSGQAAQNAVKAWDKPWAHQGVHEFVNNLKANAENRAQLHAGQESAFSGGGALTLAKPTETKFSAVNELGSKEAYSAVLKSKSMQQGSMNKTLETGMLRTAGATERSALGIARIGDLLAGKKGGGEQGASMTAGN